MKTFLACCAIATWLLLYSSCQKEIVWQSIGELKKETNGNCAPIASHGTYAINAGLTGDNFITVSVNITLPGTYHIYTDTVNGYSFSTTGNFKSNGITQVALAGSGKPASPGTDDFTVFYNESFCTAAVVVTSDTVATAVYSLADAFGDCLSDSVQGTFVKGASVDTSTVLIAQVYVTSPGAFSIKTTIVNGYSFSAIGEFKDTGIQSVRLLALGTPVNEGTDLFSFVSPLSACTFQVPVLTAVPVTNNDLLPLAEGNFWVYDDLKNDGNTITQTITGTQPENGNDYYILNEQNGAKTTPYLFRKSLVDNETVYDEYTKIDKYTTSFSYNKVIDTNLVFLKENIGTGTAWESVETKDTASFGQVIFLKYYYQCIKANTVMVINGKAFANVYQIHVVPEIKSEFDKYGPADPSYFYYYARGIGLIYRTTINNNYVSDAMQIKDWKIN